jgi:hypothetical protein
MQPPVLATQRGIEIETDSLIAGLYSGRLTYGEFNSKHIDNVTQGSKEIARIRQGIATQNQQTQAYQRAVNCAAARAQVAQRKRIGSLADVVQLFSRA